MHSFIEHCHPDGRERISESRASDTVLYKLDLSKMGVEDFFMTLLTE